MRIMFLNVLVEDEKRVSGTSLRRVKKRFLRPVSVGEGESVCKTSLRRKRKGLETSLSRSRKQVSETSLGRSSNGVIGQP